MAANTSFNSFDLSNLSPVSVISSYDTEGNITLLYIRLRHEPLKVLDCLMLDKPSIYNKILRFKCKVQDGDYVKELPISLYKEENLWVVDKMYTKGIDD